MSVLPLSQQTQVRLPKIKLGLLQRKTREEIGVDCQVTERTIRRDITDWVKTEDFVKWIREVWLDKYRTVDDVEAFRQATKIMIKDIVSKAEMKAEIHEKQEVSIDLSLYSDDDKSILDKAAAILNRKGKGESTEIH